MFFYYIKNIQVQFTTPNKITFIVKTFLYNITIQRPDCPMSGITFAKVGRGEHDSILRYRVHVLVIVLMSHVRGNYIY